MTILPAVLNTPSFLALWTTAQAATLEQNPTVVLWQYIDTVDASVLPHLSEQLAVSGFRGWFLCRGDEIKQRNLLKKALYLHSKAGTIEAIRCALEVLGYPAIRIEENPANKYNGKHKYDGTINYNGRQWATFTVDFLTPPPAEDLNLLYALILAWKPERSRLIINVPRLKYDGSVKYDGTQKYTGYYVQ